MSDGVILHPASTRIVDFRGVPETRHYYDEEAGKTIEAVMWSTSAGPNDSMGNGSTAGDVQMNAKQLRARARRRASKGQRLTKEAFEMLSGKPIEEWDEEELARGRPRGPSGGFRGRAPSYLPREVHERAMERFKSLIREGMNVHGLSALQTVEFVLNNDDVDDKGKPIVNASTKLDAAKWLLEHVVGKPTQPTTTDVSIKLQSILGTVMVNPTEHQGLSGYSPAHMGQRAIAGSPQDDLGVIDVDPVDDDDD